MKKETKETIKEMSFLVIKLGLASCASFTAGMAIGNNVYLKGLPKALRIATIVGGGCLGAAAGDMAADHMVDGIRETFDVFEELETINKAKEKEEKE